MKHIAFTNTKQNYYEDKTLNFTSIVVKRLDKMKFFPQFIYVFLDSLQS